MGEESTPRTELENIGGQSASESGWVSTDVSAKALGVTPRTVRRLIERGELEGRKVEQGIVEAWEVSIDSLYSLRSKRETEGHVRRETAEKSATTVNMADVLRELSTKLEERAASEGELRARLELTERAESTLREERDRLARLLDEEREERQRRQEEAERLRTELEAERSKGFWRRLFGG